MVLSYLFKSSIISYNTEWYLEQNTLGPDLCTISAIFQKKMPNKLLLSWVKLKFSLVRVVDEVTVIFNSVEVEIEVTVELSLLFLVGGWWVEEKKTKLMLYSTQL